MAARQSQPKKKSGRKPASRFRGVLEQMVTGMGDQKQVRRVVSTKESDAPERVRNPFARKLDKLVEDHKLRLEAGIIQASGATESGIIRTDQGIYQVAVQCDGNKELWTVTVRKIK